MADAGIGEAKAIGDVVGGATAADAGTAVLAPELAADVSTAALAGAPALAAGAGAVPELTAAALPELTGAAAGLSALPDIAGDTSALAGGLAAPTSSAYPETASTASPAGISTPPVAGTPAALAPTGAPADVAGGNAVPNAAAQQTGSASAVPSANSQIPMSNAADALPGSGSPTVSPVDQIPKSSLDKALSSIKGNLPLVNTALTGTSLLKQVLGPNMQSQYNKIAGAEKAVSNDLLSNFQKGQISGADAFAIQQYQQQQTAAVNQYYAQAGLSNSSMHQEALQQVQQTAEKMRQQALSNMLSGGLQAAGVSDPTLKAGLQAGVAQDAATMAAMQKFLQSLSSMNGLPAPSPAPAPAPTGQSGG